MTRVLAVVGLVLVALVSLVLPGRGQALAPHLSSDQRAVIASKLQWQTGTITLRAGLAKLALGPGYRFLAGPDAEKVLHDLWGNPPSDPPLGMIFPPGPGPLDRDGWGVIVEYEEGGHVNDSDAATINYDDLLKQMQGDVRDSNAERQRLGYPAMELVGWAQPPHYDAATHKLFWAKELREVGTAGSGLNYNIRVLGRKGVLVLNAVAGMDQLDEVAATMPKVMATVDFEPGNTYADFDPRVDKVAKYGIAALVAGTAVGVAAKAGLLKFALPALLALKKFIIIIVVAVAAAVKKIAAAIKGRSSVERPFEHPQTGSTATQLPTLNPPPPPNRDPLRPPPDPPGTGWPPSSS